MHLKLIGSISRHLLFFLLPLLELFDNYMQQDAHEFLNYLLNTIADLLQEEKSQERQQNGKLVQNGGGGGGGGGGGSGNSTGEAESEEKTQQTWVHEIFQGTLTNETRCLNCEAVSWQDGTHWGGESCVCCETCRQWKISVEETSQDLFWSLSKFKLLISKSLEKDCLSVTCTYGCCSFIVLFYNILITLDIALSFYIAAGMSFICILLKSCCNGSIFVQMTKTKMRNRCLLVHAIFWSKYPLGWRCKAFLLEFCLFWCSDVTYRYYSSGLV